MMKDIDLNFNMHPLTGDVSVKSGSSAIRQSVINIVMTNYYERGLNAPLGTDTRASLFENVGPLEIQTLKDNIQQALDNFEPRIEIIDIIASNGDNENEILITISYTELNNPQEQNVSIPLTRIN